MRRMLALRLFVASSCSSAAAACAVPPPQAARAPAGTNADAPKPRTDAAPVLAEPAQPRRAASVLEACTANPFGHADASTGQAFRGSWFECERARLYAAKIEGPNDFVEMMVGSTLENQKRLARDRGGLEVVEESGVKILLGGKDIPAWRVVLQPPNTPHHAIMLVTSFIRDGVGYALVCVAPDDNAEVACHHPYDDLMEYAIALDGR